MVLFDNIEIGNLDKTKLNSAATLEYVDDSLTEKGIYIQNGKLGIKNPSPQEEIDVSGTIASKSVKTNLMTIWNPNDTANQDAILNINVAGASSGDPFIAMKIHNENNAEWSMGIDNVDNLFKIKSSYDFSGTGKLVLNQSGLLGIGVEAPTGMIHLPNTNSNKKILLYDVTGNQHQYSGIGTESNGSMRYQIQGTGTNHIFYSGTSSSASSELMRITGTGRVGIGMANPTSKVGISTSVNEWGLMMSSSVNTGAGVLLNNTASGGRSYGIFSNSSDGRLRFTELTNGMTFLTMGNNGTFSLSTGQSNGSRIEVDGTGNVGMGTTTPTQKLDVRGNLVVGNKSTNASTGMSSLILDGIMNSPANLQRPNIFHRANVGLGLSSDFEISFQVSSASTISEAMRIKENGNVGIGTTEPTQKLDVNGNINVSGRFKEKGNDLLPVGTILPYGGLEAPSGFFLCNGDAKSSTQFKDLYDIIGTRYGAGGVNNGVLHFKLPDLRCRVPVGQGNRNDSGMTPKTIGQSAGAETHTLTNGEMPNHNHGGYTQKSSWNHVASSGTSTGWGHIGGWIGGAYAVHDYYYGINSDGGNQPHNNMQPYLVINYIIKY